MVRDVLAEPDWAAVLTAADKRGLTPLFWSHILPVRRGEAQHGQTARPERSCVADIRQGDLIVAHEPSMESLAAACRLVPRSLTAPRLRVDVWTCGRVHVWTCLRVYVSTCLRVDVSTAENGPAPGVTSAARSWRARRAWRFGGRAEGRPLGLKVAAPGAEP